tara:strand:+ start:16116 stop:16943 length:828 start_codon:yes stop_codon:yes gene_type:complete
MNLSHLDLHITNWLHSYAISNTLNGFVVGVSGGVDSALTSALCASTGLETHLIELPIHQDKSQSERAISHMKFLKEKYDNVRIQQIDLSNVFDNLSFTLNLQNKGDITKLSLANTRARLRMTMLYGHAQNHGLLVVGTGNKIEDFGVGFFTKYGDGGVDISPIADLYKSEVFLLASYKGVAKSILEAAPTDGLWEDQRNDEDQIGASYKELEKAMKWSKKNKWDPLKNDLNTSESYLNLSKREKEVLRIFANHQKRNAHKMSAIPVCIVPSSFRK